MTAYLPKGSATIKRQKKVVSDDTDEASLHLAEQEGPGGRLIVRRNLHVTSNLDQGIHKICFVI
jgi:hypothetical protein